jgi:heterodisulfide reductase subunit A
VATSRPGIFVVGAAAGPSDMDDSFSTAGLAAVRAVSALRNGKK